MMNLGLRSTENQDPFGYYAKLRSQAPLVWDEGMNGWLVSTYNECKYVLSNEDIFRHPYANADETIIKVKGGARNITIVLGEEHASIRKFILQAFSPVNVKSYADNHIKPIVNKLIENFKNKGKAELYSEFACPLPTRLLMSLFGMTDVGDEEVEQVMALHEVIATWAGGRHFLGEEATQEALAVSEQLNQMLLPLIRDRKQNPGDDLISKLWQEIPGVLPGASELDVLANCRELFFAGSETTVYALSNAIYLLLTKPDICHQVRADTGKSLDNFIEEVIRVLPSVHYRYRIANKNIEVGGIQVKKDQVLFTINASANRDQDYYGCPADLDLNRRRPRDHLGFNTGPRMCVGVALARMEMRVALMALLEALPDMRLEEGSSPPEFTGFFQRCYTPLHVRF